MTMENGTALTVIDAQALTAAPPTMVRPLVSGADAVAAWNAFQEIKNALVTAEDVQHISGRDFIKKSGYLKIAAAFGINTEIRDAAKDDLTSPNGSSYFQWRLTVRATAPNGRYMEAVGACASNERRFSHADADVYAQAQTRATSRAISNLVGGGEVSAEEMSHETPRLSLAEAVQLVDKCVSILGEQDACCPDTPEQWKALLSAAVASQGDLRRAYKTYVASQRNAPESAE